MKKNLDTLTQAYYSMAKSIFKLINIDIKAESESGHQFILIFCFGLFAVDGKSKGLSDKQIYELVFDLQKLVIGDDDDGTKILVDNVFEEANDTNPASGTFGMLFSEGAESHKYWIEKNLDALNTKLNNALSYAEFEVFGRRIISQGEDSDFTLLRMPSSEQLPPPNSEVQHYNNFSRRFNPVPYFKRLWGEEYWEKAQVTWLLNIQNFKENKPTDSSPEELLLCIEYSCAAGPYIGSDNGPLDFFRWLVAEIKVRLEA